MGDAEETCTHILTHVISNHGSLFLGTQNPCLFIYLFVVEREELGQL